MFWRIVWAIVSFPFALLDLILTLVFPGRSGWSLHDYERQLIEAAARGLDDHNKAILGRQLNRLHFVERLHEDRVTTIHFKWRRKLIERMTIPKDYNLAKLRVKSAGGTIWVSIGAYDGLIYSIWYKKPPKPVFAHPFEVVEAEYGGEFDDSVVRDIDREEHGDVDRA